MRNKFTPHNQENMSGKILLLFFLSGLSVCCSQQKKEQETKVLADIQDLPANRARRIEYLTSADSLIKEQDHRAAILLLNESIKMDSSKENIKAFLLRSKCYLQLKEYRSAILDATFIIKNDSGIRSAFFYRAVATIELSKETGKLDSTVCQDLQVEYPGNTGIRKQLMEKYCK